MNEVEFEPAVPDLRGPAPLVAALARDGAAPPEWRDTLSEAGALPDGELHEALAGLRETLTGALVELDLERGERRGRGWLGPTGRSVLAHPLERGRARLVGLASTLLVDALVRLNDVGPRPRYSPAVRIALEPGALAEALAVRDPDVAPLDGDDERAAFESIVRGLREHWLVRTHWKPAPGSLSGRVLEVLDTQDGYWLVVPDEPTVELWPTTPTMVFRSLCGLFPMAAEVARD